MVSPMGKKKKKKKKGEKKGKQKDTQAIEERYKKAISLTPPDDNPFKQENENKIDRFRPVHRNDRKSIKEKARLKRRESRPKRSKKKYF